MSRAVMQQALEALEEMWQSDKAQSAITALRAALAEPEQEPCAMRYDFDGYGYRYIDSGSGSNWQTRHKDAEPLFTAPTPKPEQEPDGISWLKRDSGYFTAPTPRKPLTYDELEPLCEAFDSYDTTQNELVEFARAIERAHGITGDK